MKRASKFSPEAQERAVRMVVETQGQHGSQPAAIEFSPRRGSTAG